MKAKKIFRRDPLVPALSRLAPGRGVAASLHWAPPSARAVWEHEVHYEQIIVQLYGVRNWTVCTRGLPPPRPAKEMMAEKSRLKPRSEISSEIPGRFSNQDT